jgi:hypothetical protein
MRRSSTTVSGPATVLLRRYGAKLLQNSSDNTRPRAPAIIRMIPTVLMLNPEALTFTAKVKIAPTTSRKMLTPRLKLLASSIMCRPLVVHPLLLWLGLSVRPWVRSCCYESPAHQAALASRSAWLVLQHNLLYTAVTRAKEMVVLVGSRRALAKAIRTQRAGHRYTALTERLRPEPGRAGSG